MIFASVNSCCAGELHFLSRADIGVFDQEYSKSSQVFSPLGWYKIFQASLKASGMLAVALVTKVLPWTIPLLWFLQKASKTLGKVDFSSSNQEFECPSQKQDVKIWCSPCVLKILLFKIDLKTILVHPLKWKISHNSSIYKFVFLFAWNFPLYQQNPQLLKKKICNRARTGKSIWFKI